MSDTEKKQIVIKNIIDLLERIDRMEHKNKQGVNSPPVSLAVSSNTET